MCIDIVEICFWIADGQISSVFDSCLNTSVFSFLDDNFTKYEWVFTKLGVCIDIVDICFGIANGRISLFLTELSARSTSVFYF